MGFQWITISRSCAVCLALEGYHDEEPERPHPKCDCDIFEEDEGIPPGTCWGEIAFGSDLYYIDGVVSIEVDVFKICANGMEVHDSFDMEKSFDDWYRAFIEEEENGEKWNEWHDELYARIQAMCEQDLEYECTTFVDPTP